MKMLKILVFLVTILPVTALSQNLTRGIIVDSLSMAALSGVHIRIKNSARGTITDGHGSFSLATRPTDTLLISRIGYIALELPLFFEETGILIRLRENVRMLNEITITGTRLNPGEIVRTSRKLPQPLPREFAFISPFDYFSKWQREKRKLLALIRENDRTITYVGIVTDQDIRENLMEEYSLTEQEYFDLLVKFNQQSSDVLYSTNRNEIISSIKTFFEKESQ